MSRQPDWSKISEKIGELYNTIATLGDIFPGRNSTMDGQKVGSIGEVIAAHLFDLDLRPGSAQTQNATAPDGRLVQVNFTQERTLGFRSDPNFAVVLQKSKGAELMVVFNGPGHLIWNVCGPVQQDGARPISVFRAILADGQVAARDRISQVRRSPI